jgi:hypothetical protein
MTRPASPPRVVWVAYCTACGEAFVAARSKRSAAGSIGCGCISDERIRVARYVLAARGKGK